MEAYDSTTDTLTHIRTVQTMIQVIIIDLMSRMTVHDVSKLNFPEKECFDEYTPKLKGSTYGSNEYKGYLSQMSEGLKHHYQQNSHHPEHFENSVDGMNLMDLIEMFCDWKAATLRHADGDILKSIHRNEERFGISRQISNIFRNTVKELGW